MPLRPPRVITLTTDYGLNDHYAGVLHGVILGIDAKAVVVDLCHNVPPQDISYASFLLACSWRYFPSDTIHVAVVDPGVGGRRKAIAVASADGIFVGPDNGLFSDIWRERCHDLPPSQGYVSAGQLAPHFQIVELTNASFWLPQVSTTFHGRDIFAPVAAHLSRGVAVGELGEPAKRVFLLPASVPEVSSDGSIVAHVLYIDHFGNMITDLRSSMLSTMKEPVELVVGERVLLGIGRRYEGEGPIALIGSSGRVEIAVPGGSAASVIGGKVGLEVVLRRSR